MSTPTIQDQIAFEKESSMISAERYYLKQDKLRDTDRGDEVDAARRIMRERIAEVGLCIESISQTRVGIAGKYNKLLKRVATFDVETGPDYNVLAYLGIKVIFQVMRDKNGTDWSHVASAVATKLEFEHKTRKFEQEHPGYYFKVMESMTEQCVTSYKHVRNTLAKKMNDFDMEWEPWDNHTKVQLANKILLSIVHKLPDVFFRGVRYERDKTIALVATTPAADDWLSEFEAERGYFNPTRMPALIKPRDYFKDEDNIVSGGYYSHRLTRPLVKAYARLHKEYIAQHDMEQHIAAINKLQAVRWKVNTKILDVQRAIFLSGKPFAGMPQRDKLIPPEPPQELEGLTKEDMTDEQLELLTSWKRAAKAVGRADRKRVGKIVQFKMAYDVATKFRDRDAFYYVYTADFRGRIYADTTGLSPQSNDTAKALLRFADEKPITTSGLYWLAVHGANCFGNDKISYEDRVDWIYDQHERIRTAVSDPIGHSEWWTSADKPWQFLAFCFEWDATEYGANPDAPSSIAVGLDGSCNGIQHYSALLRDHIGGKGVNLTNSRLPADIYQDVSDQLLSDLRALHGDPMAAAWIQTGLGRKLAKRPVMTLPYGSTQTSAREYIMDWALDNMDKFPGMEQREVYQACQWLTPHLWTAMSKVVVAARAAMDWIQKRTSQVVGSTDEAMMWLSPVDFPVYQPYSVQETDRVRTRTLGGIDITTSMARDTDEVHRTKQRSGIAPNFVHSLDSSHMVRVINASDFTGYAMIHDDFGTHAADVGELWKIIRVEFYKMYTERDWLYDWSFQQGAYEGEYPKKGDLNLGEVVNSEYFFC